MYSFGRGVPQDLTEAARLCRLAADQGDANAQCQLAGMYYYGDGVPPDLSKAAQLLKLACDQGNQNALDRLGTLIAPFLAGTRVRITGLTAAADLNGRLGTVVTSTKPLAAGRIAVRIEARSRACRSRGPTWDKLAPVAPYAKPTDRTPSRARALPLSLAGMRPCKPPHREAFANTESPIPPCSCSEAAAIMLSIHCIHTRVRPQRLLG